MQTKKFRSPLSLLLAQLMAMDFKSEVLKFVLPGSVSGRAATMFGDDSKDRSFELSGLSDQTSSVGKSVYPLVPWLSRARVVAGSFLEPALLDILILLVGGKPKLGVPADIGIA